MEKIEYSIFYPETKDLDVYYHGDFEDIQGFLVGMSVDEIFNIYKSIDKCSCGGDIELHEFECMGDGSYLIKCKKCGRTLERSQYDCDINKWEDVLDFCIRDWKDGLCSEDIKKKNEDERNKKRLELSDFDWKTWHANNIKSNPIEGIYDILYKVDNGRVFGLKWTIEYQYKEIEPMCISNEIECYNLFMQRYFDFEGPMNFPEPNENIEIVPEKGTLHKHGINDKGEFIRSYKTLEEAKIGALYRCGWNGINKNTILKDTKNKTSEDFK